MKNIIYIFLIASNFIASNNSFSQIAIECPDGSFEDFFVWGDGYIGSAKKNMIAGIPKYRDIVRYDANGKIKWQKKIDPKSNWNDFIVNENGKYAYFIDVANLTEGGIWQREYPTDLFIVYRLNKEGVIKTIKVNYKNNFSAVLGPSMEGLEIEYLHALETDLFGVISKSSAKKGGTKEYYAFRMLEDESIKIASLGFPVTEAKWHGNGKSQPIYVLKDDKMITCQINRKEGLYEFNFKVLNLNDMTVSKEVTNSFTLKEEVTYGGNLSNQFDLAEKIVRTKYVYEYRKGDYYYSVNTLGSYFNFYLKGDKIIAAGNYFVHNAGAFHRPVELRGLFTLDLDYKNDKTVTSNDIHDYPLTEDSKKSKLGNYTSHFYNGKLYIGISYKKMLNYYRDGKLLGVLESSVDWFSQYAAIKAILTDSGSKFDIGGLSDPSNVYRLNDKLVLIELVKIDAALGSVRKLLIHKVMI